MIVVYNPVSGEILRVCHGPDSEADQATLPGEAHILTISPVSDSTHYVSAGMLMAYSEPAVAARAEHPGPGFDWSPATGAWIDNRTLDQKKRQLRAAAIKKAESLIAAGVVRATHRWAIDAAAAQKFLDFIEDIRDGDPFPSPFSWPNYDDELITMTQAQFTTLAKSLRKYRRNVSEHLDTLKAQIALATAATVGSIDIAVGWPT